MKKILLCIFLFALLLRTIKLSTTPYGFHADEVRVGWNAYSILKTGLDDRGNALALHYNTFGDFRPSGIFYLTLPSIAVLGLNEFSVRFPSAILGAATVVPLFYLAFELTRDKRLSFLSSLLYSISPWAISVSRSTSEVAMSLFFVTLGLFLCARAVSFKNKNLLFLSFLSFVPAYFLYHTARLLIPIFVLLTTLYFWKHFNKDKIKVPIFIFVAAFFLLTGIFTLNQESRGRFNQVAIVNDIGVQKELTRMPFEEGRGNGKVLIARIFHNKLVTYSRKFVDEYTNYFSPNFLITDISKPGRYTTPGVGVLTIAEFILLVLGLISLTKQRKFSFFFLLLLFSPLAAALTTEDSPNLHRSFYMSVFTAVIEAYGLVFLFDIKKYGKVFSLAAFTFLILNFVFYTHMYFIHAKYKIASARSGGAKELGVYLNEVRNRYDKIILTNIPDDPYPWLAFLGRWDPSEFNQSAVRREKGVWEYQNFLFSTQRCPSRDAFEKITGEKLMVVDAVGCATESKLKDNPSVEIEKEISLPDESIVYTIWTNK